MRKRIVALAALLAGLELLPDSTFITTTYGHWEPAAPPYIMSVRFTMAELDALAKSPARR